MEQPQHSLRASTAAANKSPTRRIVQIGAVVILHIGLFLGLTSGLAKKMMEKLPEPIVVDVTQQEMPKEVPPPPPPEQVKPPPPPVVPPPDIQIAADIAPPPVNTIQAVKPTEAPKPDPMAGVTSATVARRANCAAEFYPALSARMHEEGTVVLKMVIGVDGVPKDVGVQTSSGKSRLDEAAIACVKTWRYKPAMKDGAPIEIPGNPQVIWKLN